MSTKNADTDKKQASKSEQVKEKRQEENIKRRDEANAKKWPPDPLQKISDKEAEKRQEDQERRFRGIPED